MAYGVYAATQNNGLRRFPFFRRFCRFFISPDSSGLAWASAAAAAMAVAYFKDHPSPEPGSERRVERCSAALEVTIDGVCGNDDEDDDSSLGR